MLLIKPSFSFANRRHIYFVALSKVYILIPLYRCTSMYIGRGQVLSQNLLMTYPPPILGRIGGEFRRRRNMIKTDKSLSKQYL